MAKTIPQVKKIERGDPERVEPVSVPYSWQKQPDGGHKRRTPDAPVKTVPMGKTPRRR